MPEQQVVCVNCRQTYPLTVVELELSGGDVDVGTECPHCKHFVHSYFLSPRLKEMQARLKRHAERARKSEAHWQRYQRKKVEYQREFDRYNQKTSVYYRQEGKSKWTSSSGP